MANKNLPTRAMKFAQNTSMTAAFFILLFRCCRKFFKISVIDNKKYQEMAKTSISAR